jgi:Flp pilus assembly protein TadD
LAEASEIAERVLAEAKAHAGEGSLPHAVALLMLSKTCFARGKFDEALQLLQRAKGTIMREAGELSEAAAVVLSDLARAHLSCSEIGVAEEAVSAELAVHEALGGEKHPYYARALSHQGAAHLRRNNSRDAERFFVRAVQLCVKHFGSASIEFVRRLLDLGTTYSSQGRSRPARLAFERALRLQDGAHWRDEVLYARTLRALGSIDELAGDLIAASERYSSALDAYSRVCGSDHALVTMVGRQLERVQSRSTAQECAPN